MTPAPFPGMDPYLEEPTRWPGVHTRLLTIVADTLAPLLAPHFIVAIEERSYRATPDDLISYGALRPDIHVVSGNIRAQASTSTLVEPIGVEEMHERYLEVRDTRTRAVIATIELVSPANKAAGTEGRRQFLQKRRRIMASYTHWIEIDLLRGGERPPEARGRGDYYALLRRAEDDAKFAVWEIGLKTKLPVSAIPTLPTNPDVALDLQMVVDRLVARGMYAETIDYDKPVPAPPLSRDRAQWVGERIAEWRRTLDDE